MMRSIKRYTIYNGIVPSNWIATIDHTLCRGCSECTKACPADTIAIERGKVGDMLYDNVGSGLGRAAAHALALIERMPPGKAAMAVMPLRSVFLNTLVKQLRSRARA
jgi:Fe-S-cluster-containing hydrogenase component 2